MSDAKFISKRADFNRSNEALKDMIQERMSGAIEQAIKNTAGTPVKHGLMKADVRHFKTPNNHWRVEADKGYSAVQEAGVRAGSRPFTHYTTPGTSAGWFKRAIDSVISHREEYIAEVKRTVGL